MDTKILARVALPHEVHEALAHLAIDLHLPVRPLLAEGALLVLAKHGRRVQANGDEPRPESGRQ